MGISNVNTLISLQESQLIHMLHQRNPRADGEAASQNRRAWMEAEFAARGQNMPGAEARSAPLPTLAERLREVASEAGYDMWQPSDPSLSPEKINALLSAKQAQEASLDSTLLIGDSITSPAGRTLIDYLTAPDLVMDGAANDDTHAQTVTA